MVDTQLLPKPSAEHGAPVRSDQGEDKKRGPDPVVGIGLVILGVLVMGIGGAATFHYVFNIGTAIAIVGALVFLVSVVLSSLRDRSPSFSRGPSAKPSTQMRSPQKKLSGPRASV